MYISLIHLLLVLQTTYENFRYRYDRRANPYNKGVMQNLGRSFTVVYLHLRTNSRLGSRNANKTGVIVV